MPSSRKTLDPTRDEAGTQPFLPYLRHHVDEQDIAAVLEVLRGDWLTTGPAVEAFERALASRVDARHAIACANGTAALHLAALAIDLQPGDFAIVPSITFLATANAVRFVNAEVVFADVDPNTGLMGLSELEDAWTSAGAKRVRAVLPVQLAGQCADPAALHEWAKIRNVDVITDCAHSLGTTFCHEGKRIAAGSGSYNKMAVFSFHPAKTVTMGEGGALATNDDDLAERLRRLRSHGMTRELAGFVNSEGSRARDGSVNPWYYEMSELGFNYRVSDINCALGLSQLSKLDRFIASKQALVARYDQRLTELAPLVRPLDRVAACEPAWHLYVVRIDFQKLGVDRAFIMNGLKNLGVGSQVNYIPVHNQPYYRNRYGQRHLPGAESYYAGALSLPLFPGMKNAEVDRVVDSLQQLLACAASAGA